MNTNRKLRRTPVVAYASYVLQTVLLGMLMYTVVSCDKEEVNQPPIIKIESIETVVVGKTVTLDGSATTDPEGQALTYRWEITTKPATSQAVIVNQNAIKTEFTADKPGTYIIVLTVTDTDGQSTTKEITITINVPGKAPVAQAGQSTTVAAGNKVVLDGSKSADPDGDPLTYRWSFKSKPAASKATITAADRAMAEFVPDVIGEYAVTLTVSDNNWPAVTADVSYTAVVPAVREVTGAWTAADGTSGGNDYTPRNHFYTFDVKGNNQPFTLTLTSSDINVGFYVYDPLGNQLENYISINREVIRTFTKNAGTYTVLVVSQKRYDIGSYKLAGKGIDSDFKRSPAKRVKAENISFGAEGGGGFETTPRNHVYSFEVTEDNSYTDLNIQSTQIPVWFQVFAPNGESIHWHYAGTPRFTVLKLNKGTYTMWAGSGSRDAIGSYTLDIFGQVQNLKQYEFNSSILNDSYIGAKKAITYSFNVTEVNTPIDVSLRSPEITGAISLYNPNGELIGWTYAGNYRHIIERGNIAKGTYKVVIEPGNNTTGIGKYTLSVYGKYSDLKKL